MLLCNGDHDQLINLDRALVIDAVLNSETKKWEVQVYFTEAFCDVIRAYETEDHARQCVDQLRLQLAQHTKGSILGFTPCISATSDKEASSKSKAKQESTGS